MCPVNTLTDPTTWVLVLAGLGVILPAIGLFHGFRHTRALTDEMTAKVKRVKELSAEEDAAREGLPIEEAQVVKDRYKAIRDAEGIALETWDSITYTSLAAQAYVWRTLLDRTRGDLTWIVLGLACSGAADVLGALSTA